MVRHGEEGPQLVRPQRLQGLREGIQQHAHFATSGPGMKTPTSPPLFLRFAQDDN
jgi:hypothetical protein